MPNPQFTAINAKPGWSRASMGDDSMAIEELARKMNEARPANTYFVCGLLADDRQASLYRIETHDPLEIIKQFEVGTHAEVSYGENALPKVLEEMAVIHARNPIVPFFADLAGFKCTFENALTKEFGDFINSVITEGCEAYVDLDDMDIGAQVLRERVLRLWWD